MRLAPLFDMTVRYTEITWVEPLNGPGGKEESRGRRRAASSAA